MTGTSFLLSKQQPRPKTISLRQKEQIKDDSTYPNHLPDLLLNHLPPVHLDVPHATDHIVPVCLHPLLALGLENIPERRPDWGLLVHCLSELGDLTWLG